MAPFVAAVRQWRTDAMAGMHAHARRIRLVEARIRLNEELIRRNEACIACLERIGCNGALICPGSPATLNAPRLYGWGKGSDRRWRKLRAQKLADEPRCEPLLDQEEWVTMATEVHHRKPISEGGGKYDWANLESSMRRLPGRSTWRPTEDPDRPTHRSATARARSPME